MTTQTTQTTLSRPMPQAPSTLARWFPIGTWLPKYNWGKFRITRGTMHKKDKPKNYW